jgi:diacylglycerol kinase (ATP)
MSFESPFKSKSGLARLSRALGNSLSGLAIAWREEAAFRQELLLVAVLLPVPFVAPTTLTQTALMLATLLLVLIVELMNSAVEAVVDRVGLERHELAKRAKDTASAAVLLALVNLAVVWGLVLYQVL